MEKVVGTQYERRFINQHALLKASMIVILLALLIAISGCGDKEPAQRKAFIEFIQTRLLATQTLAVPQLSEEQIKSFGEYSNDYAVITDFHQQMDTELNASLAPVFSTMNSVTSVNALLEQRDRLQEMANNSAHLAEKIDAIKLQADARHDALKQPQDLKEVYDQAYNKVVSKPAALAEQVFTLLPQVLKQIVVKADFIKSQGKNVTISGSTLQFATQSQLDKYNAIQKKLVPLNAQLMELSRQMQQMVH